MKQPVADHLTALGTYLARWQSRPADERAAAVAATKAARATAGPCPSVMEARKRIGSDWG